jgi:protein-tyrosine phosphatase
MFQIRDWLFISGYPVASNRSVVKKHNIQAMLQLFEGFKSPGVETLFVGVVDGQPLTSENIREGVAYVRKQHKKGKRILVTCGAGVSRSVTFSVAALKEIEGLTLEEAYLSIRERHKEALPDHIHWDSLREYYGEGKEFWEIWQSVILDDDDL